MRNLANLLGATIALWIIALTYMNINPLELF